MARESHPCRDRHPELIPDQCGLCWAYVHRADMRAAWDTPGGPAVPVQTLPPVQLPAGDVALVKDVLHHWPSALVRDWLEWARQCGKWKWLVLTQDRKQDRDGADCPLGGYRALDPVLRPLREIPGLRRIGEYLHKAVLILPET